MELLTTMNDNHKKLDAELLKHKPNDRYTGPITPNIDLDQACPELVANKRTELVKLNDCRKHPFWSPKITLEQANHHFSSLQEGVKIFGSQPDRHATITDIDPETGERIYKLVQLEPVPTDIILSFNNTWGSIREALDQMVTAAGVSCGLSKTKLSKLYFPFARDQADFLDKVAEKTDGLHADIVSILMDSNAYKGGDDPLWAVNRISNQRKHAALSAVAARANHISAELSKSGANFTVSDCEWDSNKNELEYGRSAAQITEKFDFSTLFIFDIVVDEIETIKMRPILRMTNDLISTATRLCDEIEDVCVSLGHINEKLVEPV